MLKYLLFRGMVDILMMFYCDGSQNSSHVWTTLEKADAKAAAVWEDGEEPLGTRAAEYRATVRSVVDSNLPKERILQLVLPSLAKRLREIFEKFYGTRDSLRLIGQTNDQAHKAQLDYINAIVDSMQEVAPKFTSHLVARFKEVRKRNSIPLLSVRSVSGLWQLCQSPFYRRVISLVSTLCRLARRFANGPASSTNGFNRSLRRGACTTLAATSSPPSTISSTRKPSTETRFLRRYGFPLHPTLDEA
jgi:hypothetical protein